MKTVFLPVLLALLLALPAAAAAKPACCEEESAAETAALPGDSIYQADLGWTTDAGQPFQLRRLEGRVEVALMFFARCPAACPMLVARLQSIDASLPPEARARVGYVLVSFDSAHDTPAVLRDYRKLHGLDSRWTLLHGDPANVRELSLLLGVNYRQLPDGAFAHSNTITVLSPRGQVVYQLSGLTSPLDPAVAAIEQAAR